jgi:peptide chain release factor subunit 1
LKGLREVPDNGLILLDGAMDKGGGQTDMVQKVLIPPEPVPINIYRCDSTSYLEPLEGMVHDKEVYGLIVIDRSEATLGLLKGQRVEMLRNIQSFVPRKHSKGGQSQRRFERLIEETAHNFFKHVGEACTDLFEGREGLEGLLVGGPGATKDQWLDGGFLHHELEKKIIDSFDTGYTDEYGLRELYEAAHDTLEQRGLTREKDLVNEFLAEVRQEGGKFTYGEKQIRHALTIGAVDTLLLSEQLRRQRVELACPQCEHAWEETTEDLEKLEDNPPTCPECNHDGTNIGETVDVVKELTQMADDMGTTVEIISTESEEGQMLMNAFGGMAGILRFRIN